MLTNLPHRISFMKPSRTVFEGGCHTTTLKSLSVEWANVQKINMQNNVQNFKDQQVKELQVVCGTNVEYALKIERLDSYMLYAYRQGAPKVIKNMNKMLERLCTRYG